MAKIDPGFSRCGDANSRKQIPQGLKPNLFFAASAARLKSCPDTEPINRRGVLKMKCPVCGAAELILDTRDLPYTYKGETTTIPAVTGEFCPACGESILNGAESERVMREMREFSRQVNASRSEEHTSELQSL